MMFVQLNKGLSIREIDLGKNLSPEFLSQIGIEKIPAMSP
jgi:hypothetical protein